MGGSEQALATVEAFLWVGNVQAAIEQFKNWRHERVALFVAYLTKHRHRIVNYSYFQAEGMSIGSGSVESAVIAVCGSIKYSRSRPLTPYNFRMKAYSVDLRQKVVDAYEQQEGSQRELAKRFKVSPNFVRLLLKRYQTEGTVEPKHHTGGFSSQLAHQFDLIEQLVEHDNDATLQELCDQLDQQVQIRVSPSTICRTLQQLNLTRKKTLHASQAETDRVQVLRQAYREQIRDIRPDD